MTENTCVTEFAPASLNEAEEEKLAVQAKALAHPARVRLLKIMAAQPGCVGGDLVNSIGLAQSTVSEHLRILKDAGFILAEVQRPRICYSVNRSELKNFNFLFESSFKL
ncbi:MULTISPECIES: ArsR/SmtB family transcription factor [unclassified Pseudovibrio]|uniref:ArsR/SmtB family transcription factor n=1 Tax=unclassified Pseudovibrio TaxID=2627060 RepID=UPI0007AEDC67|nr:MULTISPECIES: metalloregulator ArsR/SmtB family transcription factor [unclassified Pseudovibrio]KZK92845.1 putative HTH-type transcriptional regulator YgaV [Pseudovibrio sp. Ad5]KZL26422.1 putative HTH-type transcriptional regulator YgaV [Pseudovibrio sp. Ad37]